MHFKSLFNFILASGMTGMAIWAFKYFFSKTPENYEAYTEEDAALEFGFSFLCKGYIDYCNEIEQQDFEKLDLNKAELENRQREQERFVAQRRKCHSGDINAKKFMKKEAIKFLTKDPEVTMDALLSAWNPKDDEQDTKLKFQVIAYLLEVLKQDDWVKYLMENFGLDKPKQNSRGNFYYSISAEDIEVVWNKLKEPIAQLDERDLLEIIAQRVYQSTLGNSYIDVLLDANIDGVSCGVSGVPSTYFELMGAKEGIVSEWDYRISFNSVWMLYSGNQTHLQFLGFGSESEVSRVARNIYDYGKPKQLSVSEGYIVNSRADGSRCVVIRPNFGTSWTFFVRKFGTGNRANPYELLKHKDQWKPIELSQWFFETYMTTIITGGQGSGKTTYTTSIMPATPPTATIRTVQLTSEMHLNSLMQDRNIVEVFETNSVTGQEALDLIKKTDGNVTIIGETATYVVACWFLQTCESGGNMGVSTGHMVTVPSLISYYTQAQISTVGMSSISAEQRAVELIKFNIHLHKNERGDRYCERISQIIPEYDIEMPDDDADVSEFIKLDIKQKYKPRRYSYNNIVEWIDGRYYFTNNLADFRIEEMYNKLPDSRRPEFMEFIRKMKEEVASGVAEKLKEERRKVFATVGN